MIYVTSDLHGISLPEFRSLLSKASFSEDDTLFVLGDSIDRGEHGIELLLWMMEQYNIIHLLGNHEAILLSVYETLLSEITEQSLDALTADQLGAISTMLANGGQPTLTALKTLVRRNPEKAELLLEYLQDMALYDIVDIDDRTFLLVHAGLGGYEPGKKLSAYSADELLWHRPELSETYDLGPDVTVIFGHTPTSYYGETGQIVQTDSWWCIDTSDEQPTLVRLDDGAVFQ